MERKTLKLLTLLLITAPIVSMIACSGSSESALTEKVWKAERAIGDQGNKISAPSDFYFNFEENGVLVNSQRPSDTLFWKKDGKKIQLYRDGGHEKKEDTWTIEKMSQDTLKVYSDNDKRTMINSASDKSFDKVSG